MEKTEDLMRYYRYSPNDTFPVYFSGKRFVITNDTMISLKGMNPEYPLLLVKNTYGYKARFDRVGENHFVDFTY